LSLGFTSYYVYELKGVAVSMQTQINLVW